MIGFYLSVNHIDHIRAREEEEKEKKKNRRRRRGKRRRGLNSKVIPLSSSDNTCPGVVRTCSSVRSVFLDGPGVLGEYA